MWTGQKTSDPNSPCKELVVFSGGSAANSLVDVFNEIASRRKARLNYIIPISDNGGSSSELIRVFGGPGIGDIRSRLVRLIPSNQPAISALLNHRLAKARDPAYADWQDIVAGTSPLWAPISPDTRELLRSMLNHVNFEIMKRARPPVSTFNFSSASVGNLFLTGARLFTGSFESAIHLLALICGISPEHVAVIPALNSNFSHHISAGLVDGTVITGQNAISHPSEPTAVAVGSATGAMVTSSTLTANLAASISRMPSPSITPMVINSRQSTRTPTTPIELDDTHPEDANLPGSLRELRRAEINFNKSPDAEEDLASRIERIWYINPYGQEMSPAANPKALTTIRDSEAVIYSIGSLYTSIIPCLILRGIGDAIASAAMPTTPAAAAASSATPTSGSSYFLTPSARKPRYKILILNGSNDRETGPKSNPMTAADFIAAIARACRESRGFRSSSDQAATDSGKTTWRDYVTHLIYLDGSSSSSGSGGGSSGSGNAADSGIAMPKVDRDLLASAGIECVRVWGRRADDGSSWRYDANGLVGALEAILGRGDRGAERSRRNTMEA